MMRDLPDVTALPLPHGLEARFLKRILALGDEEAVVVADLGKWMRGFGGCAEGNPAEWALEAMAQVAPLLVRSGGGLGVVAKVEELSVLGAMSDADEEIFLRVRRLSAVDAVLQSFEGEAALDEAFSRPWVSARWKLALMLA
jgi:hypothetical protein